LIRKQGTGIRGGLQIKRRRGGTTSEKKNQVQEPALGCHLSANTEATKGQGGPKLTGKDNKGKASSKNFPSFETKKDFRRITKVKYSDVLAEIQKKEKNGKEERER